MPPKRRAATQPTSSAPAPSKRRSRLAREHSITAAQESEIREAFSLFAIQHAAYGDGGDDGMGVLRREDVRRCLVALGHGVPPAEVPAMLDALDPAREGFVAFAHFLAYAAIVMRAGERYGGAAEEEEEGEEEVVVEQMRRRRGEEVRAAYGLFTGGAAGPITMQHLRRVARELREEVSDDVLGDMIVEANGEARTREGVGRGVTVEEFEGVMRRAGVFG